MQSPLSMFSKNQTVVGVEDCLYLNVFAPVNSTNLAVMFWIHGGAYQEGAANEYDGGNIASNQGVVVVTTNYRLGLFGFGYRANSDMTGNFGLLDQRLALAWTRDNIHAFGGNPNKITIFGESAGAGSVAAHVASPESRKMFRNAIMESGSILCSWAGQLPADQEPGNAQITRLAGCGGSSTNQKAVDCLRLASAGQIMKAYVKYQAEKTSVMITPTVVDTDPNFFDGGNARLLLRSANLTGMTVLAGTNADEAAAFIFGEYPQIIERYYTNLTVDEYKDYGHRYLGFAKAPLPTMILSWYGFDVASRYSSFYNAYIQMYGDSSMSCCAGREFAKVTAARGARTYAYVFNHTTDYNWVLKRMGSYHSVDLQFVFGWVFANTNATYAERQLATMMQQNWANIAKYDEPDLPQYWPPFRGSCTPIKEFTAPPRRKISAVSSLYKAKECAFWKLIDPLLPRPVQQFR
jgi:carboxylesterase type B